MERHRPARVTFKRDGMIQAMGTYTIDVVTATGCTRIVAVIGDDEKAPLELDCALWQICVSEGVTKEAFPGRRARSQKNPYEIFVARKRNSCALP